MTTLRAVLFDVDFTLAQPGPGLSPAGWVSIGTAHGLDLDAERFVAARNDALQELERHPELDHDEEIWVAFTERIIRGMGGDHAAARVCAQEITAGWKRHENFELYDDTIPVLTELRRRGLKLGLVSNSARDMHGFAVHHALDVDAGVSSFQHGKTKPHASIFRAILELLEVPAAAALMVGDTVEDDVEGALAVGMHAILLDRYERYPDFEPRITNLRALLDELGDD